jgi:type II restriction enzyme
VNSPKAVYQITCDVLDLIKKYNSKDWEKNLKKYLKKNPTLAAGYARERDLSMIPVIYKDSLEIRLSPGGQLVYIGDTSDKWGYFDKELFSKFNLPVNPHGKMPDVIIYHPEKNWLGLIEAVTSHGPVDHKRFIELSKIFSVSKAGLVFVSCFLNRNTMAKYITEIAWETEVWAADNSSHLIHFNGERFLGPY